jgi:hypothetical protein
MARYGLLSFRFLHSFVIVGIIEIIILFYDQTIFEVKDVNEPYRIGDTLVLCLELAFGHQRVVLLDDLVYTPCILIYQIGFCKILKRLFSYRVLPSHT